MLAAMENGADKVIIKPFNIDELVEAVNELLGEKLERKLILKYNQSIFRMK